MSRVGEFFAHPARSVQALFTSSTPNVSVLTAMRNQPFRAGSARALLALLIGSIAVFGGLPGAAGAASGTGSATSPPSAGRSPSTSGNLAGRATFGIGPVTLGKTGARSFFSYEMGVGGVYSDKAEILNYGIVSLQLSVFAADLGNAGDGGIAVGLQADTPHDAGAWVQLGGRVLTATVPPRTKLGPGRVLVPFTIRVPAGASPGDHGAAIVASLSTLGKNPQGQNVKLDQRLASRIYLRVNGPLHPGLSISGLTVAYHQSLNPIGGGAATVRYTVRNTGNVRLSAQQTVSVTGLFGLKSKLVAPPGVQLLFPGASQQVSVRVTGVLPSVLEKSHVTVTPKLLEDQQQMPVPTAAATAGFTAVPWMLLLCLAGLVLVLALAWLLRRRARLQPSARHRGRAPQPTRSGADRQPGPLRRSDDDDQ